MTSAPSQAPGRPRLRPLRVSPRVAQDFCAGQRPETVWDPPRSVVQSLLHASTAAQSSGYTTALAAFFFLRFKASIVMRQKCAQPIRGTGVAISPSGACRRGFQDPSTCASIPSIRFFFKRLTATWRRTYSASGQYLSPFLPALFRPGGTAVFRQNRAPKSRSGSTKWPRVRLGSA